MPSFHCVSQIYLGLVAAFLLVASPAYAEETVILRVAPFSKGPKGTLCNLVDEEGKPTGDRVIVRGFFAEPDQLREVMELPATDSGTTMSLRDSQGTMKDVPIYHLAEAPPAPPQITLYETREKKYWLVDKDAAVELPAGWKLQLEGLNAPTYLNGERGTTGLSIVKESPEDVEVSDLAAYVDAKTHNLKLGFPDFEPTDPKPGEINGMPAMFLSGPATIQSIKGEVMCMAIEGKSHFYLMFGMLAEGSADADKTELLRIMRTFKER